MCKLARAPQLGQPWASPASSGSEKNHNNINNETYYLRVLLAGLSVVSSMATALCIYNIRLPGKDPCPEW